uniref:ATP synthase F0 subunit 8 n=1 Tax=Graneledone verrucosa TaxID=61714 RepID=UPI0022FD5609|nr:ATP synthase F0 subunit 8 [Graneledone verrucosa]WAP91556.1 ATP synthase F0 subunit 8 [Graneledone verrucosa]
MPQLSPLNWMFLFSFFWTLMSLNSSITWWNNNYRYNINMSEEKKKKKMYKW